jgi:poly(A) polymerase
VKRLPHCRIVGRRFNLATSTSGQDHEVSTFRRHSEYLEEGETDVDRLIRSDNTFGTPEEDAIRRDFTINGLFRSGYVFRADYVGGMMSSRIAWCRSGPPRIPRTLRSCAR